MQKANEFLTDRIISKFSGLTGGLDVIKDPKEMEDELSKDKLLKRDVQSIILSITPLYLSLLVRWRNIGKIRFKAHT